MKQFLKIGLERQRTRQWHHAGIDVFNYNVNQALVDNRSTSAAQRRLMAKMASSPQSTAQRVLSQEIHNSPHMLLQLKLMSVVAKKPVIQALSVIQKADWYEYGAANVTPHIHCYPGGCHLKKAGGGRINLVQGGFKRPQSIHEAFAWVRATYPDGNDTRAPLLAALADAVRDYPVRDEYVPYQG